MDRKVFERFKGDRVTVTLTNSLGLIVEKRGVVEIDGDWVYLYDQMPAMNNYTVAININKNNVLSIYK